MPKKHLIHILLVIKFEAVAASVLPSVSVCDLVKSYVAVPLSIKWD